MLDPLYVHALTNLQCARKETNGYQLDMQCL